MRKSAIVAGVVLGIGLSFLFGRVILASTVQDLKSVLVNWAKMVVNGGNDHNADGKVNGLDYVWVAANLASGLTITSAEVSTPTIGPSPIISLQPTSPPGNVKIICENRTYDGWSNSPITIGGNADDNNGNILKIIRNCKFLNTADRSITKPGVLINSVNNLLIENSTFDNIRTHIAGQDVTAVNFRNSGGSEYIKNVVIRSNKFDGIGADGIQIGDVSPRTSNVLVEGNEFIGYADVGENAMDIKSCDGPIMIRNNQMHGFRPCEQGQDCSGSAGPAIVIHTGNHLGSLTSPPKNVTIESNDVYNNSIGFNILSGINIVLRNNRFLDNGRNCVISGSTATCN